MGRGPDGAFFGSFTLTCVILGIFFSPLGTSVDKASYSSSPGAYGEGEERGWEDRFVVPHTE